LECSLSNQNNKRAEEKSGHVDTIPLLSGGYCVLISEKSINTKKRIDFRSKYYNIFLMSEKEEVPSKLFLATPCYGGMVCQEFMQSVLMTLHKCMINRVGLQVFMIGNESLITRGRNQLVAEFMASDCSHLMFVDADIEFNANDILKLMSHDKPIVTGAYPLKKEPISYVVNLSDNALRLNDLVEVIDAGTGFMMIKREVILKMQEAHPELHYVGDLRGDEYRKDLIGREDYRQKLKENLYSLFDTSHDEEANNNYLSEDYTFCRRWQKIGGKIWLDTTIKLNHIGRKIYKGDASLIFQNEN
jgi:hypothetical protein